MKALKMTQYGDIETSLNFQSEAMPEPASHEVLLKVHAASVNPIDNKVLRGDFKAFRKVHFPAGIGRDVSGEVVAVGSSVNHFAPGDQVFSRVGEEHAGTVAEFITVDATHLARKPADLSHEDAAGIPLVGLTSYQALVAVAGLRQGDKVLIHAGSGGIGSMAIQLAKSCGAYVITTTSTANVDWVKALGADQVIDYKKENYLEIVDEVDVVFDTLGDHYTLDAFQVIKQGGRVVSIAGALDPQTTEEMGLNWLIRKLLGFKARPITKAAKRKAALYRMVLMQANGDQLQSLGQLYQDKIIKPVTDRVFPFERSKDAFAYLATGRAKGKVIITMEGGPLH